MQAADTTRTIETVWRMEAPRVIAALTRIVRDVGLAEELAHDALVAALEQWPAAGVPANPAAWLTTTARRRAIDQLRRAQRARRKHAELARQADSQADDAMAEIEASLDEPIGDDLLRLVFMTCHPVLAPEGRVALTLRLLGGLSTEEIARGCLTSPATIAQRIVRAKRTLARAGVTFEVPRGEELGQRLPSVLEVVYLIFNEGYTATAGEDWIRPALCEDALRLARMLAHFLPEAPEVHGLLALLELQASRLRARVSSTGAPILLPDQNRALWDPLLIRRGLAALGRAESLGGPIGPYTLQAAIAACHARAAAAEETDWRRIAMLYTLLHQLTGSPIVELNRAVAIAMAFGPRAGLALVDRLAGAPELATYHLLPSVRGDLLFKLGLRDEARSEFERAAALARNGRERALLLERVAACSPA